MKNYDSVTDALEDLRQKGYEADFATETTCLYCGDVDLRLNHDEFNVDEVFRIEDDYHPGRVSVIYAITSSAGLKGTLVDSPVAAPQNLSCEMTRKLDNNPAIESW